MSVCICTSAHTHTLLRDHLTGESGMNVRVRDWGRPEQTVSLSGYDRTIVLIHVWQL